MEQLCKFFQDPAEHCRCQRDVSYASLAGGGSFTQIMRLPCIPIANRHGEVESRCNKYEPQQIAA